MMLVSVTKAALGSVGVALLLSGCAAPLTPEQSREQVVRNTPLARAAIPACIASAQGRAPDYAALRALGFTQRERALGSGDYFYGNDVSLLNGGGTRALFQNGEGCTISYSHESDDFQAIGQAWIAALEDAGHTNAGSGQSDFQFDVSGTRLRFNGVDSGGSASSPPTMTFTIKPTR